jgi:hypothetical protein
LDPDHQHEGYHEDALLLFALATSLNGECELEALLRITRMLLTEHRFREAEDGWARALAGGAGGAGGVVGRGMSVAAKKHLRNELKEMGARAMESGELEAARVVFESLFVHTPTDQDVSSTLGLVLIRAHEFGRARTILASARRVHPTLWQNHYNSGVLALDEMKAGRIAKEAKHGGPAAKHGGPAAKHGGPEAGKERSKGGREGEGGVTQGEFTIGDVRAGALSSRATAAPSAPSAPSAMEREEAIIEAIGHFNKAVNINGQVLRDAETLIQAARQWASPPEPLLQPPARTAWRTKPEVGPKAKAQLELKTKAQLELKTTAQLELKTRAGPRTEHQVELKTGATEGAKPVIKLGSSVPAAAAVQVDGSVQQIVRLSTTRPPIVDTLFNTSNRKKRPVIKAGVQAGTTPPKVSTRPTVAKVQPVASSKVQPVASFKVPVEVDDKMQELCYRLDDVVDAATTSQHFCDTHNLATKYCHVLYRSLVQQFDNSQGAVDAAADVGTGGTSRAHLSTPAADGCYKYGDRIPITIQDLPSAEGFVSTRGKQLAILADDDGVIWSGQASESGLFMNAGITPGPHSIRLAVVEGPHQMSLLHAVFFTVELAPMMHVDVVGSSMLTEAGVERNIMQSTPVELHVSLANVVPSLLKVCLAVNDLHMMCLPEDHFGTEVAREQTLALQIPPEQMPVGAHRVRLMLVETSLLRALVYYTLEIAVVPPRAAAAGVYPPLRPLFPTKPASGAAMKDLLLSLVDHEYGRYSQNGEDGVLAALFTMVGVHGTPQGAGTASAADAVLAGTAGAGQGFYVEFGVEDGLECNSRLLREERGWDGLLMDGSHTNGTMHLHQEW